MDVVTLGAALNGSAEYVNSHFKGGSNIEIVDNPDGTQTINASGEVSSEDTVARAEIAAIKDGETLDSFGDVETALDDKANTATTYTKTEVDTALSAKANSVDVYSKTAVDTALGNKADKSATYTKTEVDTDMSAKADKSTTYTKTEVDTALDDKVDKETGKGLSTNDYTTAEKTKLAGIAEGAEVNVQSNWTQTTTTADDYIKNKPTLGTAAAKNATDTYNATGNDVTTGKAVAAALATLPEPMVFKGSLGTGGTITTLPTASGSNKGYVYKVITAGTYASQSAKVGDTFISDGSAWVLIPSGDEPSGTVTNVAVANGGGLTISGSPITSSGTITVGHSNSVTAKTSSSVKKFTYDAYGHVTGSSELSVAESNALASGIDSTKVAQIETNKNNILFTATIGECESTGDTANKVVTVSDVNYTPHKGSIIAVKFKYSNNVTDTAEHPITLNVNNTGAYRIWYKNGDYVNASQGKIFGLAGYYVYYMFDGVDRWLWVNYGMDNTYSAMQQSEASAGTSTNERLITAKVLSDTIDEKIDPLENNISKDEAALVELVDGGAKNLWDFKNAIYSGKSADASYTKTDTDIIVASNGAWSSVIFRVDGLITGQRYIWSLSVSDYSVQSDTCRLRITSDAASQIPIATQTFEGNGNVYVEFVGRPVLYFAYCTNFSAKSYQNTYKASENMICTKAAWDISHEYQPYAMSNAELTAKEQTNENDISLEQSKTTGMTEGGSNYITVNGIRVYVSSTAPTGARTGDLWIGG